ncbi:MAG: PAS domain-containing protein [Parvibaculum sp.]|uniref:PAS domain-containing protein n=1 Tax=Parvibaculum sp. TaxID=2024848 RepID=UPI0025D3D776|nr:PAS domain-containing protein [Parvibaculum sp.]MCE9648554.1 PAS domain-containing protein [Parvibaculum sp.]
MNLSEGEERRVSPPPEKPMFLETPEHPDLAQFAAYIDAKRAGRPLASRHDINPAEILPFLPHLVVLDVVDAGEDFRVRLFGTALVELMREERTGQLVSRFAERPAIPTDPAELRSRWLTICRQTLERRQTLFFKAPTVSPERAFMVYHGMFAPLTSGSGEIGQIVAMMMTVGLR